MEGKGKKERKKSEKGRKGRTGKRERERNSETEQKWRETAVRSVSANKTWRVYDQGTA
jgi:hypothetical protein